MKLSLKNINISRNLSKTPLKRALSSGFDLENA
jgi:hypothetical protein